MNSPKPAIEQLGKIVSSEAFLGAVLIFAFVVRIAHIFALQNLPLFDMLIVDSALYDKWAQNIATGDWMGGNRAFYMDPLYPYLLGVIYRFIGHDLLVVRLLQAALGVTTSGLVAVIGRRISGKMVGNLAALFVAFYKPSVFQEGEIEKTALGVFLVTASLLFGTGKSAVSKIGAGACLALAALTRGNLLLMAPLGALYFMFSSDENGAGIHSLPAAKQWRGGRMGKGSVNSIAFLLGFSIMLAPVLWRNHHVSGEWILTTSQLGTNFYTGNNASNWSGSFEPVPFVRPLPNYEEEDFQAKAEAITGTRLTSNQVSLFWLSESLKHIVAHPWFAAGVFLRKLTLFWSNLEVPDGWSMYFLEEYSPALRILPFTLGWLMPLAFLGAITSFYSNRSVRMLLGYIATYSLSLIAFFIFSRYRVYIIPALSILAALGLCWIWDFVRWKGFRRGILYGLSAILVCVFSFFGASHFVGFSPDSYVHNYAHLAELYENKGDFKSAEALLYKGLQRQPGAASTLCALGSLYLKSNNAGRAALYIHRCLQANDQYPNAWYMLGVANQMMYNIDEAKRCLQRQLEITPGHELAKKRLEYLITHQGRSRP